MTTESDLIAPVPLTSSKTHEAAYFAHAAARVIESFGPGDAARSGDGLLDLISRHCPVSAVHRVRTAEWPSRAELRAIAAQLLRKCKAMTRVDHIAGWIADLFGLDDTERAVIWKDAKQFRSGISPCYRPDDRKPNSQLLRRFWSSLGLHRASYWLPELES